MTYATLAGDNAGRLHAQRRDPSMEKERWKVDRGDGITACAEACTAAGHNALLFGDMNAAMSYVAYA